MNGPVRPWTDDRKPASESEAWLRAFAANWNLDYDELIREAAAEDGADHWATARGVDLHSREELGADHDLFWGHLETLTGRRYGQEHRNRFEWSCSC